MTGGASQEACSDGLTGSVGALSSPSQPTKTATWAAGCGLPVPRVARRGRYARTSLLLGAPGREQAPGERGGEAA
jgi:hypothetical protein